MVAAKVIMEALSGTMVSSRIASIQSTVQVDICVQLDFVCQYNIQL